MSLVVSKIGGVTYERVSENVDNLIVDFDKTSDPELNPLTVDLIKSSPINIPGSVKNCVSVDLETEKEKESLRELIEKDYIESSGKCADEEEEYCDDESFTVNKNGGRPNPLQHDDGDLACTFDGGNDLLFTIKSCVTVSEDEGFEGGEITDYFEVE